MEDCWATVERKQGLHNFRKNGPVNILQVANIRYESSVSGELVNAISKKSHGKPSLRKRGVPIGQQNTTREMKIKDLIHKDVYDKP